MVPKLHLLFLQLLKLVRPPIVDNLGPSLLDVEDSLSKLISVAARGLGHPVLGSDALGSGAFVPNAITIGGARHASFLFLTGPNMVDSPSPGLHGYDFGTALLFCFIFLCEIDNLTCLHRCPYAMWHAKLKKRRGTSYTSLQAEHGACLKSYSVNAA
ncbi:hypothetical protein FRX31_011052 [Thalictrum thalictroides]|uniref:Uncharacterized protein n=1 Tax=Thalictrum thalictroides TaxID=46969 RepID=A0A7J6WR22_THATH|nr:hypothetical protein FRX31_011052 [Thalictrum thalictroides]